MKKITFLLFTFAIGFIQAQTVSWYQRGQVDAWEFQPDVYAFRAMDVIAYPGDIDSSLVDTTIIDTVMYWQDRRDRAIEVYFKAGIEDYKKSQLITVIRSDTLFEREYTVVTKNPLLPWQTQEWYVADDIILVNFWSPPSDDDLVQLLSSYPLEPYYYPPTGLPSGDYTYMFKLVGEGSTPGYANLLVLENSELVKEATPNFSNIRFNHNPVENFAATTGQSAGCSNNDPNSAYDWHLDNDGTFQLGFGPNNSHETPFSTLDADADICECWDLGYSGSGIKVGVVAKGGVDYTHPDWGNNIQQGWDCTQNPCTLLTTISAPPTQIAMGTFLTGLIGAKRNNQIGGAGVSPGATVVPFKIDQMEAVTSWETVIRSINEAILEEVDILVLGMWGTIDNVNLENSIVTATNVGRNNNGTPLGIVVLASPGGYFGLNGGVLDTYPASYSSVISVIGANPNDKLKVSSDLWDENPPLGYGCIAGDMYDFAAPTALITATDITTPFGYHSSADYITLAENQCFAAPAVAAGVAAMMLEKNPNQYWSDLRQELRDGAEQVGGYSYNGNGVSVEFGHGRISCINSINAIPAFSVEPTGEVFKVNFPNPIEDWTQIEVWAANVTQSYDGVIYDLNGNVVKGFKIPVGNRQVTIDTQNLASGLYIVTIRGSKIGSWRKKIIKL